MEALPVQLSAVDISVASAPAPSPAPVSAPAAEMEYVRQATTNIAKMVKASQAPASTPAMGKENVEHLSSAEKEALVAPLVAKLQKSSDDDTALSRLIEVVRCSDYAKLAIWKAGGVPVLVKLAREGSTQQVVAATRLLSFLSHFADGRYSIKDEGGLAPLVAIARDDRDDEPRRTARLAAQHALKFLALAHPVKLAIVALGYEVEPF